MLNDRFIQQILDSLPAYVWVLSKKEGTVWTNRRGMRFLYGDDDSAWPQAVHFDYASRIHPEDLASSHDAMCRMMADPGCDLVSRYRMLGPDGQYHWLEFSMFPLYEDQEEITHWVGMSHPIDRVMAEQQRLAKALLQERQERLQDSRILNEAQHSDNVQRLSSSIAHDLNNILQTILFSVETSLILGHSQDLKPRIDVIKNHILKASRVCQQFVTFDRQRTTEADITDTGLFLSDNLEILKAAAGSESHYVLHMDEELGGLKADRTEFLNCLINLLVNARHATAGRGRVELSIEHRRTPAGCHDDQDGWLLIKVVDNGEGMTEEVKARIFDPFFTTKPDGKGSGLGLPMVERFVRHAGGVIEVESTPGLGTRFELRIPAYPAPAKNGRDPLDGITFPSGLSVLIIEDDPNLLSQLQSFFQQSGWMALAAISIAHARLLLDNGLKPDLVLSDVSTSGTMHADDLIDHAHFQEGGKIIFTTGNEKGSQNTGLIAQRSVPILLKPFSVNTLAYTIQSVGLGPELPKDSGRKPHVH